MKMILEDAKSPARFFVQVIPHTKKNFILKKLFADSIYEMPKQVIETSLGICVIKENETIKLFGFSRYYYFFKT